MGVQRRQWIRPAAAGLAGGLAALGLWALAIEPRRLAVLRRTLRLPGWPAELDGLRVAVLADLHAGGPHVDERRLGRIAARVERERPDLLALLGDYLDPGVPLGRDVAPEAVASCLARIRAPLGAVAVLGNHDWEGDAALVAGALREAGVAVLEDEALAVEVAPVPLWVVGLADASRRRPDVAAPFAEVPPGAAVLALTHDPDVFPRIPERASLTLAGHTHGGQVGLPAVRGALSPSRFGDRYTGGLVEEEGRQLYVSRGIGTSKLPIRLRARPEVAILRLRPA